MEYEVRLNNKNLNEKLKLSTTMFLVVLKWEN